MSFDLYFPVCVLIHSSSRDTPIHVSSGLVSTFVANHFGTYSINNNNSQQSLRAYSISDVFLYFIGIYLCVKFELGTLIIYMKKLRHKCFSEVT